VRGAATDSVPELRRVILAMGDRTEVGETLQEALGKLFPSASVTTLEGGGSEGGGTSGSTPSTPSTPTAADPADLLARAVKAFADADAALKSGGASSLQDYADKNAEGAALVKQAQQALDALDAGSSNTTGSAGSGSASTSGSTTRSTTTTTIPATTTTGKA
jgi:uncharacterized membrane protein (UPF0182 family)